MVEKVKWEIRDSEGKLLAYQMGYADREPLLIQQVREHLERSVNTD